MDRSFVIVDIDGTISTVGDRLKYLKQDPPNWDEFYEHCDEDIPNLPICELVKVLRSQYHIIFCTGRRESVRTKTIQWIVENLGFPEDEIDLIMRKDGDWRNDVVVKQELLLKFLWCNKVLSAEIAFIIEDRETMVNKWRELGFVCLQCAEGRF